jgi:hypothetical protein
MAIGPGDVIRVVSKLQNEDSNIVENVFHFVVTGTGAASNEQVTTAVQTAMSDWWSYFEEFINDQYDPLTLKADLVSWVGDTWKVVENIFLGPFTDPPTFTDSSDPLPPGVAGLGRFITTLAKHTGRKFIAGFCEDSQGATGKLAPAIAALIISALVDMITGTAIGATGLTIKAAVPDTTDGTVRQPYTASSTGTWSYQRRRRTGVGI